MTIAFIGSGPVATHLASLAASAGHDTVVSSRTPNASSGTVGYIEAAQRGDIVVLAIPFRAAAEALPPLAHHFEGKVVIDATNPLNPDYTPINLGPETSAGETIAALLPGAKIVKAFNTIFADVMRSDRQDRAGHRATSFIASDHLDAREIVERLATEMGFAPVVAGPLHTAQYLEAMAHLNIQIAFRENGGANAAFVYHQAGAA